MKRIIPILLIPVLCFIADAFGQEQDYINTLNKINEGAKTEYELNKLNDLYYRFRQIEFSELKSDEERSLFVETARNLAFGFRNHRYIRPGYDILKKYIAWKDILMNQNFSSQAGAVRQKHSAENARLAAEIKNHELKIQELTAHKDKLEASAGNYFAFCVIMALLIGGTAYYFFYKFRKRFLEAERIKNQCRSDLAGLYDHLTRGKITAAVLYHSRIINMELANEVANAEDALGVIDKDFKKVKETEQMIRNIRENVSRFRQLNDINLKSLDPVMNSISNS